MRQLIILSALITMLYPAASSAVTGVSMGATVGWVEYSGDVLPGSGDVDGGIMFGAVMEISSLPILDFELHAGYYAQEFEYTFDVGGIPATTTMDFNDFNVLVLAKKNLIGLPMSPVALYLGAGPGWHLLSTEVALDVASGGIDPEQADNPVTLFKNTSKLSVHGLAGLRVSFPVIPFALFGEARYGKIFASETLSTTQVVGGMMLRF